MPRLHRAAGRVQNVFGRGEVRLAEREVINSDSLALQRLGLRSRGNGGGRFQRPDGGRKLHKDRLTELSHRDFLTGNAGNRFATNSIGDSSSRGRGRQVSSNGPARVPRQRPSGVGVRASRNDPGTGLFSARTSRRAPSRAARSIDRLTENGPVPLRAIDVARGDGVRSIFRQQ